MKVYAFLYNPCHYESVAKVMSLHFHKKDAYRAMRYQKLLDYNNWENKRNHNHGIWKDDKYPEWEWYGVAEMIIN